MDRGRGGEVGGVDEQKEREEKRKEGWDGQGEGKGRRGGVGWAEEGGGEEG